MSTEKPAKKRRNSHTVNRSWGILYAASSIRNNATRSMGIALLLAIGIALPTTIFSWSATAELIAFNDYFSENTYQVLIQPPTDSVNLDDLHNAIATATADEYVEAVDYYTSTVGIVTRISNETLPTWTFYFEGLPMPASGVQDTRLIPIEADKLARIMDEFSWQGNSSLQSGQVLVSQGFIEHVDETFGIQIQIADILDFDALTKRPSRNEVRPRGTLYVNPTVNLTVVGIYEPTTLSTMIARAFPSIMRSDPLVSEELGVNVPVLGISDSVMILSDDIEPQVLERIETVPYFDPVILLKVSAEALMAGGVENLEENLLGIVTRLKEQYTTLSIIGVRESGQMAADIGSHWRSQVFTVLSIPILIMSLFLTVFTSRTSVDQRSSEVKILRAKGASYNQILSSAIWEAAMLALLGFLAGLALSVFLVPLMGSSTGMFTFDPDLYYEFAISIQFPLIAIVLAAIISLFLPGLYMFHVNASIGVFEIGQPVRQRLPEEVVEGTLLKFGLSFVALMVLLLLLPALIAPLVSSAFADVLLVALILFISSYVGSRMMQQIISRVSSFARPLLGERAVYVSRSLRRRHKQFLPLLVILTLTLATTTMMMMENASLESTIEREISYAYGADIRIKSDSSLHYESFVDELLGYSQIRAATSIIETSCWAGGHAFCLEGIDATEYNDVSQFDIGSFVDANPETVLENLDSTSNGVILPDALGKLWGRSVGESVYISAYANGVIISFEFEIVGFVKSVPGLGHSWLNDANPTSLPFQLGFQVMPGGFALVNRYYLSFQTGATAAKYFLVDTFTDDALEDFCDELEERYSLHADTPHFSEIPEELKEVDLFVSGMRGFTVIGLSMCAAMGISAIGMFFGSAVLERKPEYAIMRALGATKRQVDSMVLGEFVGLIAAIILLSSFMGFIFGNIMSSLIFTISPFALNLPPMITVNASVVALISIIEWSVMFAACYYPAHVAGSTRMVEELRNL